MKYETTINGISVSAEYDDSLVKGLFIPLLRYFKELQQEKNKRILVFLAAPPGAGKSTLLSFLKYLSENTEGLDPVLTLGMDGFHHYQDYLLSHTLMRDGKEITMVKVKGAPETFDFDLLKERIIKVVGGEDCGWPEYNRMTHNPKENAIKVTGNIVLIEGNYLLLDRPGWRDLSDYADVTIKLTAPENFLRDRLIDRKTKSASAGDSLKESIDFVDFSDMANVRVCLNESKDADFVIDASDWKVLKSKINF